MRSSSTRPPGRPKQSEHLSIPDTILRVSSHLFMDHGYDAVSLDMIAERAQITKASIYYYFPTKADVFVAAVESLLHIVYRQSKSILDREASFRERLLALTETRLRVAETRFDFERVVSEAKPQLTEPQVRQVRAAMHKLADLVADAIAKAVDTGEISPCQPLFVAHAYMAMLNAAFARSATGERLFPDARPTAESIVSLIMSGLEPRSPQASA